LAELQVIASPAPELPKEYKQFVREVKKLNAESASGKGSSASSGSSQEPSFCTARGTTQWGEAQVKSRPPQLLKTLIMVEKPSFLRLFED
jgi:hypothetical protein